MIIMNNRLLDEKGAPVMPIKEQIDTMGVSVADDGHIVVRYINGGGQRVMIDLTAIIEQKAEEAVAAHVSKLHGHQV